MAFALQENETRQKFLEDKPVLKISSVDFLLIFEGFVLEIVDEETMPGLTGCGGAFNKYAEDMTTNLVLMETGGSTDGLDALQTICTLFYDAVEEVMKCGMTDAENDMVAKAKDELFSIAFPGAELIAEDIWDWYTIYKEVNTAVNYWENGYYSYFGYELAIIFKEAL